MTTAVGSQQTEQENTAIATVDQTKVPMKVTLRQKPLSLVEMKELGEIFAASGMFADVKNVAQAIVKIKAGQELGFEPFVSMGGVHIIQGKAVLSATLKASVIKDSGRYQYVVKKLDATGCELHFFENVSGEWKQIGVSTFGPEDAKAAGLAGKDIYKQYARNMFFSRALTNGMSWYCPDLLRCADGGDAEFESFDADTIIGETATDEPAAAETVPDHVDGEIVDEKSPEERREEKVEHIANLCKWLNEHNDSINWTKSQLREFVNHKYNITDGIAALAFTELDEMIAELTERLEMLSKDGQSAVSDK